MFQILLRAQYLEEENAKLREELQVQTTEKEDMKTAILQLNQRLLQNPPVISEVSTVIMYQSPASIFFKIQRS